MIRVFFADGRTSSLICGDFIPDPLTPGTGQWEFAEKEYGGVRWYPLPSSRVLILKAEGELKRQRSVVVLDPGGMPTNEDKTDSEEAQWPPPDLVAAA